MIVLSLSFLRSGFWALRSRASCTILALRSAVSGSRGLPPTPFLLLLEAVLMRLWVPPDGLKPLPCASPDGLMPWVSPDALNEPPDALNEFETVEPPETMNEPPVTVRPDEFAAAGGGTGFFVGAI